MKKALHQFKTGQGSTTELARHTKAQKSSSSTVLFLISLPVYSKMKVAQAAALIVALDISPLSFCDKHPGMRKFAKTIFELGQTVSVSERINLKYYLPGRTPVKSGVGEISKFLRQIFAAWIERKCLKYEGAVSVDGVHLKVKGRHFYDFTVHYVEVDTKKSFDEPVFRIRNLTLLLVESPPVPHTRNTRDALNIALLEKYEIGLDYFLKFFTMSTDRVAVMARVANASVSLELHDPDKTWMDCLARFLNDVMKHAISKCRNNAVLTTVANDLRSVKKIVEDANRSEKNHLLPDGYNLVLESETRFGTHYKSLKAFSSPQIKWPFIWVLELSAQLEQLIQL